MDKELNMKKFIATKARTIHFYLDKIKRIRKYVLVDKI